MAKKSEQIQQLIRPVIEIMGYELFGVEYNAHGANSILRIYIDHPNGVTLDDCSKVSEQVGAVLDVENLMIGKYVLEVSSPGIERLLFTLEHFQRYIGHPAQIKTFSPINNRKNFSGIIEAVESEDIILNVDGEQFRLPFKSITKANLRFEGRVQ